MELSTALTWSWLNCLTKKRFDVLYEKFDSFESVLGSLDEELLQALGVREESIYAVLNRLEEFDPSVYSKELEKRGLSFITIEDDDYPSALKQIGDPPVFLYYKGDLSLLQQPCIALVGAREMSSYGKRVVEEFVPPFVHAGMVTVSGLAQGVDTHVAAETIRAGGKTVAALGHGLAQIFPKSSSETAKKIIESGGLILSEFPLDVTPTKFTFPARNRIIAGLSLGTVLLQAGEESGAIITSDLALDYGREVFAVPGQIFDTDFAGCHREISKGHAKLVVCASEVLEELGIHRSERTEQTVSIANPDEQSVYDILTSMPKSVTDLVEQTQMDTGKLNAALTMMELTGAVKNVGNGQWVRN